MRSALIIGSRGQDGVLLRQHLEQRGYRVTGVIRPGTSGSERDLRIDIADTDAVFGLISAERPDEIYYLAAFHQSSETKLTLSDLEVFRISLQVHVLSLVNVMEAMRRSSAGTRLFYAASSRIFGIPCGSTQDERTPFAPVCIYGITKASGVQACRYYRTHHGLFVSAGILYNHESALRRPAFLSRKIVQAAANIADGRQERLVLGDLDAAADWGYAPDFVDAFHRVLSLPAADDFVIATGEKHTVRDFVAAAFGELGLDWRQHVDVDRTLVPEVLAVPVGDPSKCARATGWRPSVDFRGMIRLLLEGMKRAQRV